MWAWKSGKWGQSAPALRYCTAALRKARQPPEGSGRHLNLSTLHFPSHQAPRLPGSQGHQPPPGLAVVLDSLTSLRASSQQTPRTGLPHPSARRSALFPVLAWTLLACLGRPPLRPASRLPPRPPHPAPGAPLAHPPQKNGTVVSCCTVPKLKLPSRTTSCAVQGCTVRTGTSNQYRHSLPRSRRRTAVASSGLRLVRLCLCGRRRPTTKPSRRGETFVVGVDGRFTLPASCPGCLRGLRFWVPDGQSPTPVPGFLPVPCPFPAGLWTAPRSCTSQPAASDASCNKGRARLPHAGYCSRGCVPPASPLSSSPLLPVLSKAGGFWRRDQRSLSALPTATEAPPGQHACLVSLFLTTGSQQLAWRPRQRTDLGGQRPLPRRPWSHRSTPCWPPCDGSARLQGDTRRALNHPRPVDVAPTELHVQSCRHPPLSPDAAAMLPITWLSKPTSCGMANGLPRPSTCRRCSRRIRLLRSPQDNALANPPTAVS